jgi:enoyl-CoA hydratase/carnithine racemase
MTLVELVKKNSVYIVTLNDPINGNAINSESLSAHRQVLSEFGDGYRKLCCCSDKQ